MTVLTRALQRIKRSARSEPSSHRPAEPTASVHVVIEPPTSEALPSQAADVAPTLEELLIPIATPVERRAPKASASEPERCGEILLACNLCAGYDAGQLLAAGLAVEGRSELSDDVAVVIATRYSPACKSATDLREANEPGLYSCRLVLSGSANDCRRLLVLLDECRARFRRTVLLVEGGDERAIRLAAPRVDDAVVLGATQQTSEVELLRAENLIRRFAERFRPRLIVAA